MRSSFLPPGLTLLGLALFGAGCAADVEPRWLPLVPEQQPIVRASTLKGWQAAVGATPRFALEGEDAFWIEDGLDPEDWTREGAPGLGRWTTPRPRTLGFQHLRGKVVRLSLDGTALREVKPEDLKSESAPYYYLLDDTIHLQLAESAEPPSAAVFATQLRRRAGTGGPARVVSGGVVADGLSVWPGESVRLRSDMPANSALRFVTEPRSLGWEGDVTFRVSLNGAEIFAHAQAVGSPAVWHEVTLPRGGTRAGEFRFQVDGGPATTAFLNVVIGPQEVGSYDSRPWRDRRPDVIVFIADTFRADNLAAYGGAKEVAPHLNALAERSVRFVNARSPSVWTLPAHASLFTGTFPTQHGATGMDVTIPERLGTLAEHFASFGYRTGAVTDSGFVSRHYGLDRGFEWFQEFEFARHDLRQTLSASLDFLERDDGRPVFLVVHSYRTHTPYRVGPEEDRQPQKALMARIARRLGEGIGAEELLTEFSDDYLELYRRGAFALDQQLGPWLAEIERRSLLDTGYLVFTSDHGEEFGEHGGRGHEGAPHEVKVRVPLLLTGRDLEPRDVSYGASLIDLPPTLAELCGLPALPEWIGRSLLRLEQERPLFSYNVDEARSYVAVVAGERKLLTSTATSGEGEAGSLAPADAAFDLAADPGETRDVLAEEAWPAELLREVTPLWSVLSRPLGETRGVEADGELRDQLRRLGYVE